MLTQNDKRKRGSFNRGVESHQATVNSFGWNSHKYLANGDSDNISKFCALQIVVDSGQTVTVSYKTTSQNGTTSALTSEELYVGDTVYGYELTEVSISAGDARIRAYYA